MPHNQNARYEFTHYDGSDTSIRYLTRPQVLELNPQIVDHFLSLVLGVWAFRTADGRWVEHRGGQWPGLGSTGLRVLQAAQISLELLTPAEMAEITGCPLLRDNNTLSARWKALREAHEESAQRPNFFLSRRAGGFALGWNPQRSWAWLEKVPPAPAEEPAEHQGNDGSDSD
jgi:hypothetical protein